MRKIFFIIFPIVSVILLTCRCVILKKIQETVLSIKTISFLLKRFPNLNLTSAKTM